MRIRCSGRSNMRSSPAARRAGHELRWGRPTFRLLDRRVGWTDIGPEPVPCHLTEWYDPEGIQLLLASGTPAQGVIDVPTLLASLPPPRLARGCGPGSWLLLTPCGMVLRRDP